ncbi:MAG: hypothetical protein DME18_13745, partial [Verrucomicrobia bacterium]
ERIQLAIVLLMLVCVVVSLFAVKPDWLEFFKGFLVPHPLTYPDWATRQPELAGRPVWVEAVTYVGVIGGSGYDYLAYVSYLRDKGWGRAGGPIATPAELESMAKDPAHLHRRWLRAVIVDSALSFLAVLVFSSVFVVCGAVILGPQHKIPGGGNLLALQAEFVMPIYPWLKYVYFVGAFLTIFGTLYGTIEVAPTVLRELVCAFNPEQAAEQRPKLRRLAVSWAGFGGFAVLAGTFLCHLVSGRESPPGLIALLTPANLFTGVLACGLICLLAAWTDCRFLPRGLRSGILSRMLNAAAGLIFLALGIKGDWDDSGWTAILILTGTLALGWIGAWVGEARRFRRRS